MRGHVGAYRKLTDAQIQAVIAHWANRAKFLRSHGSVRQLAESLGVEVRIVRHCIRQRARYLARPTITAMMKGQYDVPSVQQRGRGRSGKLTDAQRVIILTWYRAYVRSGFQRGSVKWLALDLGVCEDTLYNCIRRKGVYKKAYRKSRSTVEKHRRKVRHVPKHRDLTERDREMQLRTSVMRAWR